MTYTYEDVKVAIAEAVATFPDRVNPTNDDQSCVYTSEYDSSHHCIAGQVLADFGLPLPPVGSRMQEEPIRVLVAAGNPLYVAELGLVGAFTHEAVDLLQDAQRVFDNVKTGTGDLIDGYAAGPLKWSVAYERLLSTLGDS